MIISNDSSNPYSWRFTNNLKKLALNSGTVTGCHSIPNKCFGIMYGSNVWSRESANASVSFWPLLWSQLSTKTSWVVCVLVLLFPHMKEKTSHTKQFRDSGRKISSSRTAWATQAEAVSTTEVRFEGCSRSVMQKLSFLISAVSHTVQTFHFSLESREGNSQAHLRRTEGYCKTIENRTHISRI